MKNIILVSALILGLGTAATAQHANADQSRSIKQEQQDGRGQKQNKKDHKKDGVHKSKKNANAKSEHRKGGVKHQQDGKRKGNKSAKVGAENRGEQYASMHKHSSRKEGQNTKTHSDMQKRQRA